MKIKYKKRVNGKTRVELGGEVTLVRLAHTIFVALTCLNMMNGKPQTNYHTAQLA